MNALTTIRPAAEPSLLDSFGALKVAELVRDTYEHSDDYRAAEADRRAMDIRGDMMAAIARLTGLTIDQLRETLA